MSPRLDQPAAAAVTLAAALLVTWPAQAQWCPCYAPAPTNNCGVDPVPGTNPTTQQWLPIFDLISQGPAVWGSAGPWVDDIGQGCGLPEPYHQVPARYPCELLMGIAQQETGWRQFCVPTTPSDQAGPPERTIISFDCGYGIGQVTSGMHIGESPGFDRNLVAGDPTYNLATGTLILAAKWRNTQCVGDNQPSIIEHWYTATWAYNGLAYINNPNNPTYTANRGVWNPTSGAAAPYQEKVFGWMEYTQGKWTSTQLAYPNPGDIGGGSSPPQLPDPSCASPTDCGSTRPLHPTTCDGTGGAGGSSSSSSSSGTGAGTSTSSSGTTTSSGGGTTSSSGTGLSGGSGTGLSGGSGTGLSGGSGTGLDGGGGSYGLPAGPGGLTGSCSCRAAGSSAGLAPWLVLWLAVAVIVRRRTRS